MRKIKVNLLLKIVIAILLGIGCGLILPGWADRIFLTFNAIFSQFLGFLIPLLILGFVAPAISDIGNKAGKMLVATAFIAYLSTTVAGFISFGVSDYFFPSMIENGAAKDIATAHSLTPFFTIEMPPLFSVMSALVLAFVVGLATAYMKAPVIKQGLGEFREIITLCISRVIIPLLPVYIFGIFIDMTVSGQVFTVLKTFSKIILGIFALHIFWLIFQYLIAGIVSGRNPAKLLLTMLPAYFTALGTQSSAATIPVTLRQTIKMGVDEDTAGFVVPLCATIHMSGSALKIVACAVALMIMQGLPYDFEMFASFIFMIGISIIAAPGVPGGAIMASLGLLAGFLGFSEADQALMIALYIAMDSFGTACNVTGDGFIAILIGKFFSPRKSSKKPPVVIS